MHGPEVLIPLALFTSIAITIIFWRKFLNDERLAAIEKGADPNIFRGKSTNSIALKFGLLFIGVGCGILFGGLIEGFFRDEEVAYFSMIFIFGGAGLFISHKMEQKENQ
ncbi:DUF6249 domain-containing protein [Imperialibacter roseus]|uniref:DUF6249 domain-containing protein n=1 Tax=Imperialibacter roseus TaxID=1324217 RepID=A0ABZ0IQ18_9BACT|nr:DUF6249 domain-containing protein [Imperialibacter roseus]WOK06085.1 DUF6249 domain-containing protein [Imperialibacter roseus]|tara:strand:+ start:11913 stop:12239 length:327 start_codon:yes stop_codon:yes gene_type:complete